MLIHSIAPLPLSSASLTDAIDEVGLYARQHLVAGGRSELSVALSESGARIQRALASVLPPGTSGFYTGRAPASAPLSAAQFLEATAHRAAKDAHCDIHLDCSDISGALRVLDALSDVAPASGRGVTLLITLDGWRLIDMIDFPVTLTLSRLRVGNRKPAASLAIRFHALSVKDPVVRSTIASATRVAGVCFGKRFAALAGGVNDLLATSSVSPADPRLRPATPQSQLVVRQTFDEALARAAESVNAHPGDLANLPLLFSRSGGFDKRMNDVRSGKHERINFVARVKRFMREQFPAYRADAADAERIWFRHSIAPTLDLLLMFDKVHQWGLGKTFSIDFGVDFPDTVLQGAIPKYATTITVGAPWIDSTEIAPRAVRIVREHLEGCDRQVMWLSLRDPSRYGGDIVWMAHGIASCGEARSRRDISVRFDRRTGELLDGTARRS